MAVERPAPDAADLVEAVQSAAQAMIDAMRGVLDVVERLLHDPAAAARATELAEGLMTGLAGFTVRRDTDAGAADDDGLEQIQVE
jgi:hypothetical protein